MSRHAKRHLSSSPDPLPNTVTLELEDFARRLQAKLLERGWSQSDLARKVWGETTDVRGYTVAKGRDRISAYVRAQQFPDPLNLKQIADALDTTPEDLAPRVAASAIASSEPAVRIVQAAGHPDRVTLIVNLIVSQRTAAKVYALLCEDEAGNG